MNKPRYFSSFVIVTRTIHQHNEEIPCTRSSIRSDKQIFISIIFLVINNRSFITWRTSSVAVGSAHFAALMWRVGQIQLISWAEKRPPQPILFYNFGRKEKKNFDASLPDNNMATCWARNGFGSSRLLRQSVVCRHRVVRYAFNTLELVFPTRKYFKYLKIVVACEIFVKWKGTFIYKSW